MQENEEKAELVSKLNSYQMQIEKIVHENSLEVRCQDAANHKEKIVVSNPELHEMHVHNLVLKSGQSVCSEEVEGKNNSFRGFDTVIVKYHKDESTSL